MLVALSRSGAISISLISHLAVGLMVTTSAVAKPESAKISSAICEFANRYVEFTIKLDLRSKEATFDFGGSGGSYPLLQKATKANELYHFDLKYSNPQITVKVLKTPGNEKVAVAILEDRGTPEKFDGICEVT